MTSVATTTIKRGLVDTPLGQVHYKTAGCGEPLLLLHQSPRSIDEYTEMIPTLARTKRVIAMDTLGYGDSDRPSCAPTIEDYAICVLHLLDALGNAKTSIVGHHTGSYVAGEVAAAYPARVDKLILSGYLNMDAEERQRRNSNLHTIEFKADGSHLKEIWDRGVHKGGLKLNHRRVLDSLKGGDEDYGHRAVFKYHQEERIPLIQAPTLLVWGKRDLERLDCDGWHASADKHKVEKAFKHCKSVTVPEGDTFMPNQMPEEFARLILEFMANPGV